VHAALAPAPWHPANVLLRIGIKGKDMASGALPPANLVFLVDVSGSMNSPDKLPLLKSSLKLLVNKLRPQDRITLVTYASGTRVALPPTPGSDKTAISAAVDQLVAPVASRWPTRPRNRALSPAASTACCWPPTATSTWA
jgi:Ca-activated chloride channel family protein